MDTIFMNSENSKTSEPHVLVLKLSHKLDLREGEKIIALKGATTTVQNEVREQKGGFLSMFLGTLGARLLGNISAGKGINRLGKGFGINIAEEGAIATRQIRGIVRAG